MIMKPGALLVSYPRRRRLTSGGNPHAASRVWTGKLNDAGHGAAVCAWLEWKQAMLALDACTLHNCGEQRFQALLSAAATAEGVLASAPAVGISDLLCKLNMLVAVEDPDGFLRDVLLSLIHDVESLGGALPSVRGLQFKI